MAKKGNPKLKRREGFRRPERLYVVVTEGETEKNYFKMVKQNKQNNIKIYCIKGRHPDTKYIIDSANSFLEREALEDNELVHCWLVLDTDVLSPQDKEILIQWEKEKGVPVTRKTGISSPEFEYWLLLHFELPAGNMSKAQCQGALKRHIKDYKENYKRCEKFWNIIPEAIDNAKQREITLKSSYSRTNLHILVKDLISNIDSG